MYKPASLRKHLGSAVPELKKNPDKLSIMVREGRVQAAGQASLSFEYAYTLQLIALDYAGSADAIIVPMLVWLRTHQREYFDNEALRNQAFRFSAEYQNGKTIDLVIELDLTEAVRVEVTDPENHAAPGRFTMTHLMEPAPVESLPYPVSWELFDGTTQVASWTTDPLDADHAPRLAD